MALPIRYVLSHAQISRSSTNSIKVVSIAGAIRGNVLTLSMDAFGCHVIQKAFDAVPEEYKATMVHELLRRIPETVIHRYACHVWQKLFELRWSDSPPQIMRYVGDSFFQFQVAMLKLLPPLVEYLQLGIQPSCQRPHIRIMARYVDQCIRILSKLFFKGPADIPCRFFFNITCFDDYHQENNS